MTSTFIGATLLTVAYSLWVRRGTWWSRWEFGATAAIALEGAAVLLMSPWAATELSPLLFRAVRLWNVSHLLGLLALIAALCGNIYHAMLRLADPDQVRRLLRRHLHKPVRAGSTLLVVVFAAGDEGHHENLFSAPVETACLAAYWLLGCGLVIFLSAYAVRVTLIMRSDPRARETVRLYVASAGFGMAACVTLLVGTWTGTDLATTVWLFGCLSVAVYAYGSARSWRAKAAWFTSSDANPDLQASPPPTQS